MLVSSNFSTDVCILLATLSIIGYFYIKWKYGYWKRRGIAQLNPVFPLGDLHLALPRGPIIGYLSKKFYDQFKIMGEQFGGIYLGLDPYLFIMNPQQANRILKDDFQYFENRGIFYSEKDPLWNNMFSYNGDEWRRIRPKFTNIFTPSKMKYFFTTMTQCAENLKEHIEKHWRSQEDVYIQDTFNSYFTDVIGSVVFGIEANSFKEPNAVFKRMGNDIFHNLTLVERFVMFVIMCYPDFLRKFPIKSIFPERIRVFFVNFVKDTIEHRRKNNIHRNDFMELCMELEGTQLTIAEITSNLTGFFLAGFETSSTSASLTVYELALHPEFQQKVREEIHEVLEKHNGEIVYEAIGEMQLLTQAWQETVRKYPVVTTLNRSCTKDYTFANSNVTIKSGTKVLIPILGYHRDETLYPDPKIWDPKRFADKNVKHEAYFPFGEGPRSCIGSRLGLLQVKLCLATLLRDYEVKISPKTKVPLKLDPLAFNSSPKDIFVNLQKIR